MKNRITRNVSLENGEVIQKEFRNLKAKNKQCSILVTDRRLIIYTFGPELSKGKRVRRQVMNEIDLRSIHRFEYFYEIQARSVAFRLFGLILFLSGLILAYLTYIGQFPFDLVQSSLSMAFAFGFCGILVILGISIVLSTVKVLILSMKSGLEEKTTLLFYPTKENELCLRYIAGKIHAY